tara:strand:+ start:188559 stop:189260 length:702 start_codon:yes stop_codon:yes gene_type:complete
MSLFTLNQLVSTPGQADALLGPIPTDALYSVKLLNRTPDVERRFNCYYVCTKGVGFSIEVMGRLEIGKYTLEELGEKLDNRKWLASSIREPLILSPALEAHCKYTWELVRNRDNGYYLVAGNSLLKRGKVVKQWVGSEAVRPLSTILHWETHEAYDFMDLKKESRDKLAESLRESWSDEQWPAPGEATIVNHENERVVITHENHMEYINPDFFTAEAKTSNVTVLEQSPKEIL